jgi:hypothetical protein
LQVFHQIGMNLLWEAIIVWGFIRFWFSAHDPQPPPTPPPFFIRHNVCMYVIGAYHLRKLKRTCSQPSSSRYSSIWDNEGSSHNRITQQYRLPEGRVSRKIEGNWWQNSRTFALSVNWMSATALNFSLSRFSPSTPDPQGRRKASQNTNQR